jgi:hypothetical protein
VEDVLRNATEQGNLNGMHKSNWPCLDKLDDERRERWRKMTEEEGEDKEQSLLDYSAEAGAMVIVRLFGLMKEDMWKRSEGQPAPRCGNFCVTWEN